MFGGLIEKSTLQVLISPTWGRVRTNATRCYTLSRGRPPYTELGRAASFGDLPEGCKNLVLDMYQKM